jgi:nucleoside-triphosphatase THEP1
MTMLAAIPYDRGFPIDRFMADLARRLRGRGLRLAGVVQHNGGDCDGACEAMSLEDLASGARFAISETRGAGASGCRLDATGLAAAGGALAEALAGGVDLVIVNKFGRQELLGRGLRQEIVAALLAGLPLLIAVRRDVLPAWRDFAGDDWVELPAEADAVETWATALSPLAA